LLECEIVKIKYNDRSYQIQRVRLISMTNKGGRPSLALSSQIWLKNKAPDSLFRNGRAYPSWQRVGNVKKIVKNTREIVNRTYESIEGNTMTTRSTMGGGGDRGLEAGMNRRDNRRGESN
jgi:hypothetical protein